MISRVINTPPGDNKYWYPHYYNAKDEYVEIYPEPGGGKGFKYIYNSSGEMTFVQMANNQMAMTSFLIQELQATKVSVERLHTKVDRIENEIKNINPSANQTKVEPKKYNEV